MMKNIIAVLLLTLSFGLVTSAQADTLNPSELSQSQLRSDPLAAFNATADVGEPMSQAEAGEMRGEAIPWVVYYAVLYAPSLAAILNSSLVNHFPLRLIQDAWSSIRG